METESVSAEEYSLTWKGHIQHVRASFNKLFQNNNFCDVTLYAEGQRIGAHKVFLTACSGYFNQLFEDIKDERPIIVLKGVQFEILQHILRFIYKGQVSIEIDKLNAFLEAADFLKITGLVKDKLLSKTTHSLIGQSDNASTADDERTNVSESVLPNFITKNTEVHSLATQLNIECFDTSKTTDNQYDLEGNSQHTLTARLLETKGYGFFKKEDSLQRLPKQHRIDNNSSYQHLDLDTGTTKTGNSETQLEPKIKKYKLQSPQGTGDSDFEPKSKIKKYTLGSPHRTGEWTSDYENRSQSTQDSMAEAGSPLQGNVVDTQNDLACSPSVTKRKRIKPERLSCNLEEIQEVESFNEEFANSLDVEIESSDEDDDDFLE